MPPRRHRGRRSRPWIPRLLCHLAAVLPFVATALAEVVHGWQPFGDDAVVAWRSFAVFGPHSPLLGQFTQLTDVGAAHPIYDLGPAEYWLLAVPVRLDTVHGVLWGAALVCSAAAVLSVEAAWSAARLPGAIVVSAGLVAFVATYSSVARDPIWNPYLGAVFLAATMATGWATARGDRRWTVGLVACATLSAQSHLVFLAPAVLVTMTALAVAACRRTSRSWRQDTPWILAALAVLAGLWAPAVVEQIADTPGNIGLVAGTVGHRSLGLGTGFRAIWSFARPVPAWMHATSALTSASHLEKVIFSGSTFDGFFLVIVVTAVSAVSLWRGSAALGTASALLVAALLGTALSIAQLPAAQVTRLQYLDVVLWPVGLATWAALLFAGAIALRWLLCTGGKSLVDRVLRSPAAASAQTNRSPRMKASVTAAALAGLVALSVVGVSSDVAATTSNPARTQALDLTARYSVLAGRVAPRTPFSLSFSGVAPAAIFPPSLVEGVAFRLWVEGRPARFVANWEQIGPWILPPPAAATLVLHRSGSGHLTAERCDPGGTRCVVARWPG